MTLCALNNFRGSVSYRYNFKSNGTHYIIHRAANSPGFNQTPIQIKLQPCTAKWHGVGYMTLSLTYSNFKKNSPRRRPLPGGAGRPKFNQLEMVTTFTYRPSLVIDRCTQLRVIVVTDPQTNTYPQTHTNPQTGPTTIHCAAASLARCIKYRLCIPVNSS